SEIAPPMGDAAPEISEGAPISAPAVGRTSENSCATPPELPRGARATRGSEISLLPRRVWSSVTNTGPSRRPWGEFAAVVIVTAVSTLLVHSLATHHEVRSDVRTEAPQRTMASTEAKLTPPTRPSPPTTAPSVTDPAARQGQAGLSLRTESPPV